MPNHLSTVEARNLELTGQTPVGDHPTPSPESDITANHPPEPLDLAAMSPQARAAMAKGIVEKSREALRKLQDELKQSQNRVADAQNDLKAAQDAVLAQLKAVEHDELGARLAATVVWMEETYAWMEETYEQISAFDWTALGQNILHLFFPRTMEVLATANDMHFQPAARLESTPSQALEGSQPQPLAGTPPYGLDEGGDIDGMAGAPAQSPAVIQEHTAAAEIEQNSYGAKSADAENRSGPHLFSQHSCAIDMPGPGTAAAVPNEQPFIDISTGLSANASGSVDGGDWALVDPVPSTDCNMECQSEPFHRGMVSLSDPDRDDINSCHTAAITGSSAVLELSH